MSTLFVCAYVDAVACARPQFVTDRDYLHHVTAPGLRANRPEQVGNNLMGLGKVLLEGSALPPKINIHPSTAVQKKTPAYRFDNPDHANRTSLIPAQPLTCTFTLALSPHTPHIHARRTPNPCARKHVHAEICMQSFALWGWAQAASLNIG